MSTLSNGAAATDSDLSKRQATWALILLTVVGTVLRAVGLNQQLWFDEIITVVHTIRVPFSQLITSYSWDNQHTFYSVLAHPCVTLLGEHPWTVRLPAMVVGTLSIPALYLLGRSMLSRNESICAAALLTVSYHHIWFSQNARGYTILMFATVLSTWCFIEGQRRGGRIFWVLYAIIVALGAYAHLTMVFVAVSHMLIVIGQFIVATIRRTDRKQFLGPVLAIIASGVLTIAIYSPMLDEIWTFYTTERPTVDTEWKSITWAIGATLRGLRLGFGTLVMLGMMVIGGIGCWRFAKSNPVNLLLLLLPGFLGLAVMMAAGRNIWPRFFLYVFGNALLIVVHGVWGLAALLAAIVRDERKREKWLLIMGYGLCLVAFAQSLRMLPPAYRIPKQDLLGALRYVEQRRQAGDRVATVGEASHVYQGFYGTDWDHVESVADLQSLLDSNSRVWVVSIFPIHLQASLPEIKTRLDEQFKLSRSFPATVGGGEIDVSVHEP